MKMGNQIVTMQNFLSKQKVLFQRAIPGMFFAPIAPLVKRPHVKETVVSMLCKNYC